MLVGMNTNTAPAAAASAATVANQVRRFYRCHDCRAVMAIEVKVDLSAVCSCGGKIKYMGYVRAGFSSMLDDRSECPCDARCTNAPGPSCDCSCGGKNHGTGRVVKVITTEGAAPQLVTPSPERAEAYRAGRAAAMGAFEARYPGLLQQLRNRDRVEHGLYLRAQIFGAELSRACKIVHAKKRIEALGLLAGKYVAPAAQ